MRIPEYDQRVGIQAVGPAPVISAASAALPYEALSRVGEQTQDLGRVIQEKQDEVFRVKEFTDRTIQADQETADLMLELEQERDPQTANQKFADRYAEIRNRAVEGVADYKVATSLTQHLASKEVEGSTKIKHSAWTWTLQNDQMDMLSQNDKWKKAAVNNPGQVDYAASMIRQRIDASIATGSILPATGRTLADKEIKDLYSQVMGNMILTDPRTAPEQIKPLLVKSGLDPTEILAMETFAENRRTAFESKVSKADKAVFEATAARASIDIRAGRMKEEGITQLYKSGKIGPDQLNHLHSVLDSANTRSDHNNREVSYRAMSDEILSVQTNQSTPEAAARRISMNASILPEHKVQGMQTLLQVSTNQDKIPPQMEKAKQIYLTKVAPSFLSINPRAEEKEAAGEVMREMYADYFANKAKYDRDPDLLIKRAMERTDPKNRMIDTGPPSPYNSPAELLDAYNYYVLGQKSKFKAGSGANITDRDRAKWEKWFRDANLTMPPWPDK